MSLVNRIKELAKFKGIKISVLEKDIGASKGVLSRAIAKNTDISSKWITRIVEKYKDCNGTWLLTGNGDMLIDSFDVIAEPIGNYLTKCKKCESLKIELEKSKRELDLQYKHIAKLEAQSTK